MLSVAIHSVLSGRYPARLMRYKAILDKNNIPCHLVDASDSDYWEKVKSTTHYIHHFCHRTSEMEVANAVLPTIETAMKKPVFPDLATRWHYDDKVKQSYFLTQQGLPFIPSETFYDKASAFKWLESCEYPTVFKMKAGAGSGNVILVKNHKQAKKLVRLMFRAMGVESNYIPDAGNLNFLRNLFGIYSLRQKIAVARGAIHYQDANAYWQKQKDYIHFQKFMPGNTFDTRITVIGNRAFAFRRHNRPDDFRASGSGLIDYEQEKIDKRCVDIALKISKANNFQSMAYDFLFSENGDPVIGEISYTYSDQAVRDCPGYYSGSSTNWVEGNQWPQYWILSDLLNVDGLVAENLDEVKDFVKPELRSFA